MSRNLDAMELKKLPNYHNYITKKASETNRLPLLLTINKYTSFSRT